MQKTNANWQSTEQETFIEILPIGDLKMHLFGDECWCTPRVEKVEGGKPDTLIIHEALDKRE